MMPFLFPAFFNYHHHHHQPHPVAPLLRIK